MVTNVLHTQFLPLWNHKSLSEQTGEIGFKLTQAKIR